MVASVMRDADDDFCESADEQPGPWASCIVCGSPAKGQHFGVLACRACSAFFRRSIAAKRKYQCQQDQNCPIEKDSRNICRACRLRKCIEIGMKEENVQGPREAISFYRRQHSLTDSRPPSNSSASGTQSGPQTSSPLFPPKAGPSMASQWPTLEAMRLGINEFWDSQRIAFHVLYPQLILTEQSQFRRCDVSEHIKSELGLIGLLHKMLNDHFPPFSSLPNSLKRKVFQSFSFCFNHMVTAYRTSQHFPDLNDTRITHHYGHWMDVSRLDLFCVESRNQDECIRMFTPYCEQTLRVVRKCKRMRITDLELAALAGLIFYSELAANNAGTDEDERRTVVYNELYASCMEREGGNGPQHMGALLCFMRDVENLSNVFQDNFAMGIFENDHVKNAWEEFRRITD